MSRFADQNLAGWGRSTVEPCRVYCPHSVGELNRVFEQRGQRSYISRGLGRSYGDAALNGGSGVILHEKMDRLLAFDPHTGVLEAEAGVSLAVKRPASSTVPPPLGHSAPGSEASSVWDAFELMNAWKAFPLSTTPCSTL